MWIWKEPSLGDKSPVSCLPVCQTKQDKNGKVACFIPQIHNSMTELSRGKVHISLSCVIYLSKGRCPGEAARHWDRAAAGTQGKGLSVFVSAPAPWPWQCPRWRCSCSPGHRACTGSWMPPCWSLQRHPT